MLHQTRYALRILLCALPLVLSVSGCEFSGPGAGKAPDPEEQNALLEQWIGLSKGGLDPMNLAAGEEITGRLARAGTPALMPLLDILGDDEASPTAKVFATSCLSPFITEEFQDPVIQLTTREHEATTRTCAVRLLGLMVTPPTTQCLWSLVEDPESRVRFEAQMMLVLHGEMAVIERFPALWQENLSAAQRSQWVLMLPETHALSFISELRAALTDVALDLPARQQALNYILREGTEEADLAALRVVLDNEPDTVLAEAVQEGLPVLEARIAAVSTP